jgi:excisionase family DNA binding protein
MRYKLQLMVNSQKYLHSNLGSAGPTVLPLMDTKTHPSPLTMMFEPLLSPEQAAPLLGVHPKTLVKMARAGEVPALRIRKHWRFRASLLDAFVEDQLNSFGQPA